VDTAWKKSRLSITKHKYDCRELPGGSGNRIFSVTSRDPSRPSHTVLVPTEASGEPLSCRCTVFTSTQIPCAGICRAFSDVPNKLLSATTLRKRWRVDHHPLYASVLEHLGLVPEDPAPATEAADHASAEPIQDPTSGVASGVLSAVLQSAYDSVLFPVKLDERYLALREVALALASEAKNCASEHVYRQVWLGISTL